MTDFVDPTVIAQINGAKDELIAEVAKITANSNTIEAYAGSLSNPTIPEAPINGQTYGRKDGAWAVVGSGGGSGGSSVWGGITGTLSDQTDLQAVLDLKANDADLATVAKTGSYSDLTGKPTILPDAPADGQQYARINNAWAKVEAELAADPTLLGTVTIEDGSNDLVIEQDASYIYFSRPTAFAGEYAFRFRVGNAGLEFSTDTNGTVWNPVGGAGGGGGVTNLGNTTTSTSVTITSSTGNNTTVSGASSFSAGVMTAADKDKLDGLTNFSGTYTGNFTLRKNVDSYNVWIPSNDVNANYVTQFQSWGTQDPFGNAEHQYDVNFKADGVYHQDVKGNGSERRLAFADELGGGGASTGDMKKAVYDTNDNGIVDTAETLVSGATLADIQITKYNEVTSVALSNTILRENGGIQLYTLTAPTTLSFNLTDGQSQTLHLNGGDVYTVTWPVITWVGGSEPTLTSADVIELWYFNSTLFGAYVGSVA